MSLRSASSPELPWIEPLLARLVAALTPNLGKGLEARPGLPIRVEPGSSGELSRGLTWVELVQGAPDAAPQLQIGLDAALSGSLVDRALGGRGHMGVATRKAGLSEAEQGVLAYLAGRATRAHPGLWVRDVTAGFAREAGPACLWPFDVRWPEGQGTALCLLSEAAAQQVPPSWLQVGLADGLSPQDDAALDAGDVLLGPAFALAQTVAGLAGPCMVRVSGIGDVRASLDGAHLSAKRGATPERMHAPLFLELHAQPISFVQLADFGAGLGLSLSSVQLGAQKQLLRGHEVRACGELVHRGPELGFRISSATTDYSMR